MRKQTIIKLCMLFSILVLAAGSLSACSPSSKSKNQLSMADIDGMPAEVKAAPTTVQQAYQFNVANPDLMKQIPCYCGCGAMGHTSNYSCYVKSVDDKGQVTFDDHAIGCSICVDITQDAMRLTKEGKSPVEIKAYVDQTYAEYGPSNMQ